MSDVAKPMGHWSAGGICGCFNDCATCCYGFWCTPCLFGANAEKVNGGGCCAPCCIFWLLYGICCCCAPCYSKNVRSTIRANYALKEAPCSDCCVHFWCIGCAVCQEARELKNRGVAQHGQFIQAPVTYAPPPQQQM